MKTSRCFVSVATVVLAVDLVVGLDPQPQENVWRNSNGSRPWQNPAWATSSKQPIHIATTQRTLSPGHIERHSLVSTGQQTTQQPKSSSPITASYSSVVGPSAQKNSNYSPSSYNSRQPSHQKRKDSLQPKPLFAAPTSITQATDQELAMLSEKIFEDDVSSYGENIKIDYQAQTRSNSIKDEAPKPLLNVEAEALNKPTVKALLQLYDNYIADSSFVESVTAQERLEESKFLDEVLQTTVMMEAMDFLVEKGLVKNNSESFKDLLKSLWFTQYTRGGGIIGSSAFEHVFLGELKKDEVSGLHNWIYFANEEKNHRADYMGYLKKLQLGKERNLLKVHFRWSDVLKPSGSMFVGTSPELELALYTVCFLTRPDDRCPVKLGGKTFGIQTYTYRLNRNRGNVIGSAYPVF